MGLKRKSARTRISVFGSLRAINPQSFLLACTVLASLTIQLVVPFLANTPCGLVIPHEHVR